MLKKDVNITGNTSVMRTKEQGSNCQETSASPSSRQSSAKKERFGERGPTVKFFEKRTAYEWEDTERGNEKEGDTQSIGSMQWHSMDT